MARAVALQAIGLGFKSPYLQCLVELTIKVRLKAVEINGCNSYGKLHGFPCKP